MTLRIEPMRPEDWDRVRGIYLEGIATGQATFETTAPAWEAWDAAHVRAAGQAERGVARCAPARAPESLRRALSVEDPQTSIGLPAESWPEAIFRSTVLRWPKAPPSR